MTPLVFISCSVVHVLTLSHEKIAHLTLFILEMIQGIWE